MCVALDHVVDKCALDLGNMIPLVSHTQRTYLAENIEFNIHQCALNGETRLKFDYVHSLVVHKKSYKSQIPKYFLTMGESVLGHKSRNKILCDFLSIRFLLLDAHYYSMWIKMCTANDARTNMWSSDSQVYLHNV